MRLGETVEGLISNYQRIIDGYLGGVPKEKLAQANQLLGGNFDGPIGAGNAVRFIRVGTLDEPDRLPPDIHIFTSSKQPWVVLPPNDVWKMTC